ncbi:transporter RarD family, DMT superfamily protein [Devosia pacifica]|uniref:Transporter RarD family, DMT superfamily protein n=1 Tax=Devosia pacifica TaxID=1335967 RepID=A0A918RYI3_9HYPH|nr:DMT family transporter [Devosia pacifica]GHA14124.1 transporter RarD family, DMT superfamily protein [Devosia pacifica]
MTLHQPNTRLALVLVTCAIIMMTAMNSAVHEAAEIAPVGQIVFWRSFVAIFPVLIYMAVRGELPGALRTRYPHKHVIRGALGCLIMFLNFTALSYLAVGVATALSYLAPILSIAAAMVFLRERPGVAVFAGVLLGFGGIIVMLFPTLLGAEVREGAIIGVLCGVGMAATSALSRVQVKDLTKTDPASSIALSFAIASSLGGLATLIFGWVELDLYAWTLLVGAGVLGGIGHIMFSEGLARAPVSVIAPYEYTGILWAFVFDIVLLGTALDAFSVVGAMLIVGAAALVAFGQSRGLRRAREALPENAIEPATLKQRGT